MPVQILQICALAVTKKYAGIDPRQRIPLNWENRHAHIDVLYWASWLDPWLSGYDFEYLPKTKPMIRPKWVDDNHAIMPRNKIILGNLRSAIRRKFQYDEQKWLIRNLISAYTAYANIKVSRVVVIKRTVIDGVLSDENVAKMIGSGG